MKNWYEQRDKRTDSCQYVQKNYKETLVAVRVTADISEYRVQLMTWLSAVLFPKWCRRIILVSKNADCLIPGQAGSFLAMVEQEIRRMDPFCEIYLEDKGLPQPSITLFIGPPDRHDAGSYVSIDAAGWTASVSFNKPAFKVPDQGGSPLMGAGFAACLANAEIFRYVVGMPALPYTRAYSLWTNMVYECIADVPFGSDWMPVNAGRVHLVGCGSIGSSFAFLLPYAGIKAQVLLVDPDYVESHNTSSSLLFGYDHVQAGLRKIDICRKYLGHFGIVSQTFDQDYRKFSYSHNSEDLRSADIVLCFANENNIWSTIQQLYPPVSFHATTSKSWGLHIGRHIPLIENCLVCTFKDVLKTDFKPGCAKGTIPGTQVPGEGESHTAILPFLAPAAAILTLAELYKLWSDAIPSANTIQFNMGSFEGTFLHDHDDFGGCFICRDQVKLYQKFGPYGQFWKYSITV